MQGTSGTARDIVLRRALLTFSRHALTFVNLIYDVWSTVGFYNGKQEERKRGVAPWRVPPFTDGHAALIILSFGYVITLVGGLTIPILQMLKARRFIYISMIGLLVLNLTLSIALIPTFGPIGAASAYTLSVLVIYAWQIYWLEHHSEINYLASIFVRGRGTGIQRDGGSRKCCRGADFV